MKRSHVNLLPASLWHATGPGYRSKELTTLYVERFAGPLNGKPPTYHTFWELLVVSAGQGEMRAEHTFPLEPGTACLIAPGIAHVEYASRSLELYWIGIEGARVDACPRGSIAVSHATSLIAPATALWELARKAYGDIGPELDGLLTVLFSRFRRTLSNEDEAATNTIDQAVNIMHANFRSPILIAELAAECGYSEGHFYREFKRITGQTPVEYLTYIRVSEAQRWLLNSNLTVREISERVGIANAQYFSRVFKSVTGMMPTAMRAQRAEGKLSGRN